MLLTIVLWLGLDRPQRNDMLSMAGVGVVGVGMNNIAFTFGVSMTTASDTALIYAAVPIWGILLGLVLGLERPNPWGVVGVALAAAPFALPGIVSAQWAEASSGAWEAVAYSTLLVAAFGIYAWQRGGLSCGGQPGPCLPVPDHPRRRHLGGSAAW